MIYFYNRLSYKIRIGIILQYSMEPERPLPEDHFPAPVAPLRASITQSDTKTIHSKLLNFENLEGNQKLLTVQNLPVMIDQLGPEGLVIMKPLVDDILKEPESINSYLLQKIPQLMAYLQKQSNLDENIKSIIIPLVINFLNSADLRTKEEAGKQLAVIANKLSEKDRGEYILKHVLLMSHDDANEDNRFIAVQLLSNMSECLGAQLCEQFIGLEFLSLCDDTSEKVKKQAIKNIPVICKMVSKHFFQHRILPVFYQKAEDSKNWGIRKACADIIISISQFSQEKERQTHLTNSMLKLLKDNNKWVKLSAYLNLGKFIYLLKGLQVHEKLVRRFLKMTQSDIAELSSQNQVPYSCAFHFPAVVSVLGSSKWPEMYKTYERLLTFSDKKIKLTLSQSIHEIAKIIGGTNTQRYLFPVIDIFLAQQNEDIKLGIVKNMAQILFVLSDQKRQKMVGIFQQFQRDQKKWRIRESIARQLINLLQMYPTQIICLYMVPLLLGLCLDPVSIVRQQAANSIPDFLDSLRKQQTMMLGLIQSIKAYGTFPSFIQRIQFIMICKKLLFKFQNVIQKYFLEQLCSLKDDKVINVKLALALLVQEYLQHFSALSMDKIDKQSKTQLHKKFIHLAQQLKSDPSQEIQQIFIND